MIALRKQFIFFFFFSNSKVNVFWFYRYETSKFAIAGLAKLFRDCNGHLKDNPFLQLNHETSLKYVLDCRGKASTFLPKLFRLIKHLISHREEYFGASFREIIPYFSNAEETEKSKKNLFLRKYEDGADENDQLDYIRIHYSSNSSLQEIQNAISFKIKRRIFKLFGLIEKKRFIVQDISDVSENMTIMYQIENIELEDEM